MSGSKNRRKLSTAVSRDTYAYLQSLVSSERAPSLAEAVDLALAHARCNEPRVLLERDTAAYFASLPTRGAAEETRLESSVAQSADAVDFDC